MELTFRNLDEETVKLLPQLTGVNYRITKNIEELKDIVPDDRLFGFLARNLYPLNETSGEGLKLFVCDFKFESHEGKFIYIMDHKDVVTFTILHDEVKYFAIDNDKQVISFISANISLITGYNKFIKYISLNDFVTFNLLNQYKGKEIYFPEYKKTIHIRDREDYIKMYIINDDFDKEIEFNFEHNGGEFPLFNVYRSYNKINKKYNKIKISSNITFMELFENMKALD